MNIGSVTDRPSTVLTGWSGRAPTPSLVPMPLDADADARHGWGLALGRELARRNGLPLPSPVRPPTLAERLLEARDWPALEDAFEMLDQREQLALDLRYGLRPSDPTRRSHEEISEALGVGRSRVGQILERAVEKLDSRL